jgi:hypothetical protein
VIKPLIIAVADALIADVTLGGLLAGDKIYNGLAPENSPFDYVTLTNFTEAERNLFNKQGVLSTANINIWTQGEGEMDVLSIYEAARNVLHNRRLALGAGAQIQGKLRLILTGAGDTADPTIVRGIAEYTMRAVA